MEVTMGLELQSILELDMVKGTLTSLAWFNFAWNDPFLKWDKEHFSREHLSSASKFGPYQKVHMYFRLLSGSKKELPRVELEPSTIFFDMKIP